MTEVDAAPALPPLHMRGNGFDPTPESRDIRDTDRAGFQRRTARQLGLSIPIPERFVTW
jgi:hypothetical protein